MLLHAKHPDDRTHKITKRRTTLKRSLETEQPLANQVEMFLCALARGNANLMMLLYHNAIKENDLIISIDNVVIDTWIGSADHRDAIEEGINSLNGNGVKVVSWEGNKQGTFRYQKSIRLPDGKSLWIGSTLISNGYQTDRYRMEFNPNKVAGRPEFWTVHRLMLENCRTDMSRIPRFDLAIDIPVDRSLCILVKDCRLYLERRHGIEYTQYLGSKSASVGRVKLYNKTAEADLDYPLTRLELTLNPETPYEEQNLPTVYCIDRNRILNESIRVSDTDRFILNAILQGCGSLHDLGRKTRVKIEKLMQHCTDLVSISPGAYAQVLESLSNYAVK